MVRRRGTLVVCFKMLQCIPCPWLTHGSALPWRHERMVSGFAAISHNICQLRAHGTSKVSKSWAQHKASAPLDLNRLCVIDYFNILALKIKPHPCIHYITCINHKGWTSWQTDKHNPIVSEGPVNGKLCQQMLIPIKKQTVQILHSDHVNDFFFLFLIGLKLFTSENKCCYLGGKVPHLSDSIVHQDKHFSEECYGYVY